MTLLSEWEVGLFTTAPLTYHCLCCTVWLTLMVYSGNYRIRNSHVVVWEGLNGRKKCTICINVAVSASFIQWTEEWCGQELTFTRWLPVSICTCCVCFWCEVKLVKHVWNLGVLYHISSWESSACSVPVVCGISTGPAVTARVWSQCTESNGCGSGARPIHRLVLGC